MFWRRYKCCERQTRLERRKIKGTRKITNKYAIIVETAERNRSIIANGPTVVRLKSPARRDITFVEQQSREYGVCIRDDEEESTKSTRAAVIGRDNAAAGAIIWPRVQFRNNDQSFP